MRFHERMLKARQNAGLSLEKAARRASEHLPGPQEISYATIRRLELSGHRDSTEEERVDPLLLWSLAKAYGVPLKKLSPVADEWLQTHVVQGERRSRCTDVSAGQSLERALRGPVRPDPVTRTFALT